MSLTSEQLTAWRKANRAPVFQGKLNRWVFVVSQEAAKTDRRIADVLQGAVNRAGGAKAADDFRVVRTSATQLNPAGGTLRRRETLPEPPIPFVRPGPVSWAEVEFAWRSPLSSVPWVAERMAGGLLAVDDPTEADWMLDSVGKPAGDAKPDQSPILDAVDDIVDASVETPQRAALTLSALAIGAILLWRKLR